MSHTIVADDDEAREEETKHVNVPFPASEHERMRKIKDWNNASWPEVIQRGIATLDDPTAPEQ